MIVKVTERDIARGVPYDPKACAIALALRRVRGLEKIVVGSGDSEHPRDGCYLHSPGVANWIVNHDAQMPVKPISLDVDRKACKIKIHREPAR